MELSLDKDNVEITGNNNTTTTGNKRTVWSDSETSLLLSFLKGKSIAKQWYGHRNREGWRTIPSRLKEKRCRTIEQIKNRHRSIHQTYVRVKDNNRRTGTSRMINTLRSPSFYTSIECMITSLCMQTCLDGTSCAWIHG